MSGDTYLLDVNVLVALTNPHLGRYAYVQRWFSCVDSWATTPVTENGLFRLTINPTISGSRLSAADVTALLAAVRAWPGHVFLPDDTSLADPVIDLTGVVGHRQVTDAHLVNLAARHGVVLATLDASIEQMLVPKDRRWVHLV